MRSSIERESVERSSTLSSIERSSSTFSLSSIQHFSSTLPRRGGRLLFRRIVDSYPRVVPPSSYSNSEFSLNLVLSYLERSSVGEIHCRKKNTLQ